MHFFIQERRQEEGRRKREAGGSKPGTACGEDALLGSSERGARCYLGAFHPAGSREADIP